MNIIDSFKHLFSHLPNDAIVVTPNRRLSRYVAGIYNQIHLDASEQSWPSLACLPIEMWIKSHYLELQRKLKLSPPKRLLSVEQELILWTQIITEDSNNSELLLPELSAGIVQNAWQTLIQWQVDFDQIELISTESADFTRWAKQFVRICQSKHLIDPTTVVKVLCDALPTAALNLPNTLIMYGFGELTPLQSHLLSLISKQGVHVHPIEFETRATVGRLTFTEQEEEIETAARWAAARLNDSHSDHSIRIGIAVPNLVQQRQPIKSAFQKVLVSSQKLSFSTAQSSNSTALYASLFLLIGLNRGTQDPHKIHQLLESPYLGDTAEFASRLRLSLCVQRDFLELSLDDLCTLAQGHPLSHEDLGFDCPSLVESLRNFQRLAIKFNVTQEHTAAEWAELFGAQLHAFGWPGSRTLTTTEDQLVAKLPQILNHFATLEQIVNPLSLETALQHLKLFTDIPIQETSDHAAIQVVEFLEARGQHFDFLWLMQLDSQQWPPAPKPNPFIPGSLQRKLNMPHASVEREFDFAHSILKRLTQSASHVFVSHAQFNAGLSQEMSPLIKDYPSLDPLSLPVSKQRSIAEQLIQPTHLESLVDIYGPPVFDAHTIKGGTQLLKDQAACAFRAFAKHRMAALDPSSAERGVSAIDRGKLVHEAMDTIWYRLRNQKSLIELSNEQLDRLIRTSIANAWKSHPKKQLWPSLKRIESELIFALIKGWLHIETLRPNFKVAFRESQRQLHLGDLRITIRFDRVDQVDDDGLIVIDYKTGHASIKSWAGTRPDEPQIPLYCIAHEDKVVAAAVAQIHVNALGFIGIADNDSLLSGLTAPDRLANIDLPSTWPEILTHWRDTLERLANEFLDARAEVGPKQVGISCRYCTLHGLCRIQKESQIDYQSNVDMPTQPS